MGDQEGVVGSVGFSRRSFVKKLLAVGFAVPVISSFALDASANSVEFGNALHHEDCFVGNQSSFVGNQNIECDRKLD